MIETQTRPPAVLAIDGEIATITLDRPMQYNTIDFDMAARLDDLAQELDRDSVTKVVIIRGSGAAFCGGGDIRYFVTNADRLDAAIRGLLTHLHRFLWTLRHMSKITIASVHGPAAGAGVSLAALCDLCIASDQARFTPAYAALGVTPDVGGSYALSSAVGPRRALQIFLGEEDFTAEQAERWGLVTKLVPHDALAEETHSFAKRLCRASPEVLEGTKRLIREGETAQLHDHLINEMNTILRCMRTESFDSAMRRFVNRS